MVYQDVENIVLPVTESFAGNDMVVCPGNYILSATAPGSGETGNWVIIEPNRGVSISDHSNPQSGITISGDTSGDTRLVWTISNSNGCSCSDTIVITNIGALAVNAGPERTLSHCYSVMQSTELQGSYAGNGINGQQGTWTLISGPNIPEISNIHNNNSAVNNLIEGTYIFRWEVDGPCQNGIAYDTIIVPAPTSDVTDAGGTSGDYLYCDGRVSVVLNGTFPRFTNETVLWEKISGPDGVTIENPENHIANITGLDGKSNYSFRYTITNNITNCISSAVVNISYADGPLLEIAESRVDLVCGESVANISYTSEGSGEESWSIASGPVTDIYTSYPTGFKQINGNSGILTIPGLTVSGTYIVSIRKAAPEGTQCEAVFANVVVVVSKESSLSNAGTDQLLACDVYSTYLAGNTPAAGIGTWTQVSGPDKAVIKDIHDPGTEINGLINGAYTFRWIISGGYFCNNNQDDVVVIVADIEPTPADAGEDMEVCINTPVYLNANKPVLNEWGKWSVIPENAPVVFNDPASPDTYAEGFEANLVYQLVWTIENACGESSDTIEIITNDIFGPIMSDAGIDLCLPSGTTSFSLLGNDPYINGQWRQVNGTGAVIGDPASPATNVTVPGDGTYYFEWAISANGCEPTMDTVRVTIAPDVTPADAGSDQEVCGTFTTLNANVPNIGMGRWVQLAGPGGVIIENEFSAETEISELTDGVYKFAWIISNEACDESSDTVTVYISGPGEEAVAGDDISVCGASSVIMQANDVSNGLWSVVSGPNTPTISDYTSPVATIGNLIMGTYLLSWNSYGGIFCEPSTDIIEISVVPTANAGSDLEYCEATTSVDLVGNINSTGTWTQIGNSPDIAIITQTSPNSATASGLIPGVYTFEYEISEGDCFSTDQMTVTLLSPPPVADAGENAEYCDAVSFMLTGNSPEGSAGEWILLFGPSQGNFENINDSVASFTPSGSNIYGTYLFTWKISNGDCENEDQVRVINYAKPAGNAGEDIEINCKSSLFLNATLESGSGYWTFISATGDAPEPTIVSPVLPNSEITGLGPQSNGEPAIYQFEWTITNGVCEELKDTVTVTVYQAPTKAVAGDDAELCNQNSYTLNAVAPAVGEGEWSFVSGPNTPAIADVSSATTEVNGLVPGTYIFLWETKTEFCSSADSVTVINYAEPSAPDIMTDFDICQFENLILENNEPESGTAAWIQIAGPDVTILNPEAAVTQVVGVTAGSVYTFRRIVSNGVCNPKNEDVTITVIDQPTMALAGADQFFCNRTETVLDGNEPVVGTGKWTVESGPGTPVFEDENQYDTKVSGLTEGLYTFRWTVSNQDICETYDEMQITVYPDMTVSVPAGGDICSNGTFNLSVTATGGTGSYSYRWQEKDSQGEWIDVSAGSGAGSASYTTAANLLPGTYFYRVEITDCNTIYSDEAEITVHPDVEITEQPEGASVCPGSTHSFNVTAENGVDISYQWQQSISGEGGWSDIAGADSSGYTTAALDSTMFYRVRISDAGNGCSFMISDSAGVFVPAITTQPAGAAVCDGDSYTMSLSVDNRGGMIYAYQWQFSDFDCISGWMDIEGANDDFYVTNNLPKTGIRYFRCVVSIDSPDCSDLISECVPVTITGCNPLIGVSNQLVATEYNGDGTWDALFTIRVQNYGDTELNDIQVTQDLDDAFEIGNYTVTEITSTSFAVDTEYDGSSVTTMLTPAGNTLQPGASTDIVLRITIRKEGTFYLSATGTGKAPGGTAVSDISQNGSDPDPEQDGDPTNNSEPTPVSTECINAAADAGPDTEICAGSDYHILLAKTENEENFIWSTSGDGIFNSETVINPVYTPGPEDISAGTVSLTLTANSFGICPVAVSSMILDITSVIPADPVVTDAGCINDKSGTVQLSVDNGGAEPFIYKISTGESNSTGYFENLSAGNYLYKITDAKGCTVTGAFEINDPDGLQLIVTDKNNVSCFGGNDGSVTVEASGGTGNYTFEWPDGITTENSGTNPQTAAGFTAGLHFVTITDENSCAEIVSFEISEPHELNLVLTDIINPACDNAGQVMVTGTGGVPPYFFTASAGTVSGNIISGLSPGDIVITITDKNGCTDELTVTLTDNDNEPPVFTCPEAQTIYASDNCKAEVPDLTSLITDASDNCSETSNLTITQSIAAGTLIGIGVTTVTITVTDESGNSAGCTTTVTVIDETVPDFVCSEPIVTDTGFESCYASILLTAPEVEDNCSDSDDINIIYRVFNPDNSVSGYYDSDNNTYTFMPGISRVEWTMTDQAGNSSVCLQQVTVNDTEPPRIACSDPDTLIFESSSGLCGYIVTDNSLDAVATDNCDFVSLEHDFYGSGSRNTLRGAVLPVGTTDITWTAADNSGNTSQCSITVVVEDNEAPVFVNCAEGTTFTVGLFAGACEGGAIWSIPVAWDACSDVTVEQISGPERGSLLNTGIYNIVYRATDKSGNFAICSFFVEVTDAEYPVIVCQPDIEKAADTGACTWKSPESSLSPLLANSNCPATVEWRVTNPDGTISTGYDDVSGYTFRSGTSIVYYSIEENESGQDWHCSFKVTVTDNEKPVISCPEPLEITALPGMCDAVVNLKVPYYTDNCSEGSSIISYVVYASDNSVSNEILIHGSPIYQFMAGINRVEWKVTDEAGNYSVCWQTVRIKADKDALIPDTGPNSVICETDSFHIVNAVVPEYATAKWTTSGSGFFVDDTAANPVYIPSRSDILDGTVILSVTASSLCESASDNMVLTIIQTPEVWAGDDAEICENDTYRLNGNIGNRVFSVKWETLGTGTFSDPASFNPVYIPGAEDIEAGSVILVFRGIPAGACEDATDSLTLFIHRQPEIFAGDDAAVCEGESYILSEATIINVNSVIWSTGGTGSFSDVNDINATYIPSKGDILNGSVVLTVDHIPDGPCAAVSGKMVLNISKKPSVNAGTDLYTCYEQPVTITTAEASDYSTLRWTTNGNGELQNPTSVSPSYLPAVNETGEIKLTLTVTGTGACFSETISDEIVLTIYDELFVDTGDNDTVFINSPAILDLFVENGSGSYFYSWMPESMVLDSKAAYTETVKLTSTQEFTVLVKDAVTGCMAEGSKTIFVESSSESLLDFFNAFSPNGDGVNDNWQIRGIEKFPDNKVLIFNRWGDKVKELHNYDNISVVWDGTNNRGKLLPDGTYYYIVTLNKEAGSYTGWVHIRSEN